MLGYSCFFMTKKWKIKKGVAGLKFSIRKKISKFLSGWTCLKFFSSLRVVWIFIWMNLPSLHQKISSSLIYIIHYMISEEERKIKKVLPHNLNDISWNKYMPVKEVKDSLILDSITAKNNAFIQSSWVDYLRIHSRSQNLELMLDCIKQSLYEDMWKTVFC